ncbi:putative STAM-binding protein [Hypsibius exemplaris]|uniref:STAM-binding protein n=1 Tax=Hypsibius exemplaris TaxID=2072580 RepID=A0A1W0XCR8_HYPEX|nr:putative STAM-binding protein [Hypsibius exemplaris]
MATVAVPVPRPSAKERLTALRATAESAYIDPSQSIIRYYRSSKQLYETASYEANHGNNEKAYMLIMRFLDLYVTRIPKHPKYHSVPEDLRNSTKALIKKALDLGQDLKIKLLADFENEIKLEEEDELNRQRALQRNEDKSSDLDDLVDRIGRLNALHDGESLGFPRSAGEDGGENFAIHQAHETWPADISGARIGTEAWPSNENEDFSPTHPVHPTVDRSTKPRAPPRGRISSETLRPVRVPAGLVKLFSDAAKENTMFKNIETCGNLWGVRESGSYVVTHVLIPNQKGTDSYCEDLDEGTVAEYAITRDLIQLGWIHTHPSQTAFLSSVDMHMQHGYQIMLPEAIAIVLAPTYDDVGFFRLTDYGMDIVSRCREGTTFHTHDDIQPLFDLAEEVLLDDTLPAKIEDFR